MLRTASMIFFALVVAGCASGDTGDEPSLISAGVATMSVEVVESYPHDESAFTQGLVAANDEELWESVGRTAESNVRRVTVATGEVVNQEMLADEYFGEGLTAVDGELVQLTWRSGVAFVRDSSDLTEIERFTYDGEGWGLAFDAAADELLMSDGTPEITRRDPSSFEVLGRFEVRLDGNPVDQLNELEWVDGVLYANVWKRDEILQIDPSTGDVTAVVDASGLCCDAGRSEEMALNGIAHRPSDPPTRLVLTGKLWPELFVVDLVPQ